ncbi:hypothetical protein M406DRAFT_342550 [Cryphonectria parasitica EP155]|uniref:Uncharacterized protein n=1 Tax=Cryphonectria parasitica (strain ATCC 38755 / EP155) TaxID=660469 RepID=A0A9P5CL45_CRYP1|nr:uncharacterized protein M406DRAFT_342550 [Cryphonectria parasitica EP155]KAF3761852.1 hypothetical protein M406DRAFT_342550 [Cryphonectria parasitica EP155]
MTTVQIFLRAARNYYGVPVPRGQLARIPEDVARIVEELDPESGRGKGTFDNGLKGGIQLVDSPSAGKKIAEQILGHRPKTKQTTGNGLSVDKVYVAEVLMYDEEWYLAIAIDRENFRPAVIISKSGGMDIETVAKQTPDEIAEAMWTSSGHEASLGEALNKMHKLFISKDATLMKINPLVRHADTQSFTCLDAKFSFGDAAKPRQQELFAIRDRDSESGIHGLVYIQMDGSIGHVVNGAGLAMATNDAIAHHGGTSANLLDAGGQATTETMQKAFEIIRKDDRVNCILVNIYGGIIRCDMIAESIIGAAKKIGSFRMPLEDAHLGLHTEAEFGEAAKRAVELAGSDLS